MTKEENNRARFLKIYVAFVFTGLSLFPIYNDLLQGTLIWIAAASLVVWYLLADIALRIAPPVKNYVNTRFKKLDARINGISDLRFFLILWAGILIIWIPAFCTFFPGTFGYDAPVQLLQWTGKEAMNDAHPITHTVLIGLLYDLGTKVIGGQPNLGVAIYTTLQVMTVAGTIAYSIVAFRRFKVSAVELILSFVWFAFNPFIQTIAFNCTKDILFGAFLMVFILVFAQVLRSGKWDRRTAAAFIAFGLLTCLFRHQGVYFLLAVLLFLLAAPRKANRRKKEMTIALAMIIAVFEIFGFVCHNVVNFEPINKREWLSVPIQQMAYVCKQKIEGQPVNVSDEQLSQVETFIPAGGIILYERDTADSVKATFSLENFTSNLSDNISLYLKLGIQNPSEYLYVFRNMTQGYFDSDKMSYMKIMFLYTFQDFYEEDIHRSPLLFGGYQDVLMNITLDAGYQKVPVLGTLYKPSISIWLLFLLIGIAIYRKNYDLWLIILPVVLQFITLLFGPVALIRYQYPIMMLVPFMLLCCFNNFRDHEATL